jgi:D-glycero-alpha-D-manno-heptose-7-phosphate kinase
MIRGIAARSPLRISFAGGGTDVEPFASEFGTAIVSATIDLFAEVDASKFDGESIVINSIDTGERISLTAWNDLELKNHLISACSLILPREKRMGLSLSFSSPVAPGSGLGASSALVVAMVKALFGLQGKNLTNMELAALALRVERDDLKIAGGFQDQYASTFGGFNYIEANKSNVQVTPLSISREFRKELEQQLILIDLSLPRSGQNVIADQQRNITIKNPTSLAATKKQLELGRKMRFAFLGEDPELIGKLMSESWYAKRDYSSKITTPRIDAIVSKLESLRVLGAKVTGAGGGGHLLAMLDDRSRLRVLEYLEKEKIHTLEFTFTNEGATQWNI